MREAGAAPWPPVSFQLPERSVPRTRARGRRLTWLQVPAPPRVAAGHLPLRAFGFCSAKGRAAVTPRARLMPGAPRKGSPRGLEVGRSRQPEPWSTCSDPRPPAAGRSRASWERRP